MKIILSCGGNQGVQRFEASPDPQEAPTVFGEAMIARGLATKATPAKTPKAKAATNGTDI